MARNKAIFDTDILINMFRTGSLDYMIEIFEDIYVSYYVFEVESRNYVTLRNKINIFVEIFYKKLIKYFYEERVGENMSKEKALKTRKRWLNNKERYCIVDTETTGLGKTDIVVEIAIIDLDGNILLNTLVNPKKKIHWAAEKVHGISNSKVQNAPDIREVARKVNKILKNKIMIAYNAKFDARMIKQSFNLNVRYECLMHNVMDFIETHKYVSLEVATTNVRSDYQEHRALEDCYLCLKLIKSSFGMEEEVS